MMTQQEREQEQNVAIVRLETLLLQNLNHVREAYTTPLFAIPNLKAPPALASPEPTTNLCSLSLCNISFSLSWVNIKSPTCLSYDFWNINLCHASKDYYIIKIIKKVTAYWDKMHLKWIAENHYLRTNLMLLIFRGER